MKLQGRPTLVPFFPLIPLALCAALAGCGSDENAKAAVDKSGNAADVVYRNGEVLTVDAADTQAQAIAVRDGKVLATGSTDAMRAYIGTQTSVVDLAGKTLIPGFYDGHSHFLYSGLTGQFDVDLNSPPLGTVDSIDTILARLRAKLAEADAASWITGSGYDDTLLAEQRHPTREDLDKVSATRPIFISHISGHLSVANSAALAAAGIDASTPDPAGGVIRRDSSGKPTGVLEESASNMMQVKVPAKTAAQTMQAIRYASGNYAAHGVTTANDGASSAGAIQALEGGALSGNLSIRVVAWPTLEEMEKSDAVKLTSKKVRIGGIKDFADGSIQGYTGYLSHAYHTPYHGDAAYRGSPRYDRDTLAARVTAVYKAGKQSLIHGNGDEGIADILYAFRKAQEAYPRSDARPIIIHSQMATESELDDMKTQGVMPSFFVLHTYYWGDRHRDIFLGPERAQRISPTHSAEDRGMRYTLHTDTPVVPMDPLRLIWSAVNRVSTSGAVIGAEQRVSASHALRATTINSAWQNFEEKERGSLEAGKYADMVILSANPTTVAADTIKDIQVLETFVEGKSVYRAAP